ncbi:divalent metal cation transporter [Mesorhizobium sp. BAC0120]|uniref:NRAMP family divalent metal transporter n=1 Tax=Mesorhizobium sp. BAC0120 TaxID=3090670 RepID=UPI00298C1F5D|nr:divalent metal cation transporter [Mesorhizobium sp. BAC0120]MDW6022334.1 divalent metal cation transporter [Mesorhizobium sp. BAC0120]
MNSVAQEKDKPGNPVTGTLRNGLARLGPGFIAGASDDDPSGIGTYSQAGAQLGFGISWTMLLTYPLMAAIQEISARIGRTTGHGIAGNLCRHYPNWLLQFIVLLLFIANTINIGADLSAMADSARLLVGGPSTLFVIAFASICVLGIVFMNYSRYSRVLKWMTLSLFSYVVVVFFVQVPWQQAVGGLLIPRIIWSSEFFTTLLAIFGTTISPYLFFWQASQEVEDLHSNHGRRRLLRAPRQALDAFSRIRADTLIGMAVSNVIALAIIVATAATLHQSGITNIETSVQAADALRPIAGDFAFAVFALGIVGTGLLAVPVLAASAAYAIGEARRWPVGLSRQPREAVAFYSTLAAATGLGVAITLSPIDPIKALYWTAVINGVVAVPVMTVMMLMTAQAKIMGEFTIRGWLRWLGWASTGAMAICLVGMLIGWIY